MLTLRSSVVPTTGSIAPVGFVSVNDTSSLPTGAVTTGFNWYGTQVVYAASDSDWELMFWAIPTNATGFWKLVWNAAATDVASTTTPVAIKRTGPTAITADAPSKE